MLLGTTVYAGCQWAMLAVVARHGGAGAVGQYALALAIAAPVMLFADLSLRPVVATDARGEYGFADYFAVRSLTSALAFVVIAVVAFSASYPTDTRMVLLAVAAAKVFESLSGICYGWQQRRHRLDRVSRSMQLRGILGLAALAAVYWWSASLPAAVLALATVWALVWWYYDLPISRHSAATGQQVAASGTRGRRMRRIVVLSLPLGVVASLVSLNANIPRYFVEHFLGAEMLGVFAAMAYLVVPGGMVVAALGQAASPRLAELSSAGRLQEFQALLIRLLLISLALALAGLLLVLVFGEYILVLLYGAGFSGHGVALAWIMACGLLAYPASVLGYGLTARRIFKPQPWQLSAVFVTTITGSLMLLPAGGLAGAAQAWMSGLAVQLAGAVLLLFLYRRAQHGG